MWKEGGLSSHGDRGDLVCVRLHCENFLPGEHTEKKIV